jgi:aspartyl-tRNA(Asn)/glutamyl-tRNA(Gln) amidotransferase subunit A
VLLLREAGIPIRRVSIPVIAETKALAGSAQIVGFEAYRWHQDLFAAHADRYDPRVAIRLATGGSLSASTYADGLRRLADLRKELDRAIGDAAGMLLPTVPIPAPHLDALADDEAYLRLNAKAFSLTATANHFDLPSVSLRGPCPIMLVGRRGHDRNLLELGSTLEYQMEVPL